MYLCKQNFGDDYHVWDPWYGCTYWSEGCKNCYVTTPSKFVNEYFAFSPTGIKKGTFVTVCLKSDFFLEDADHLRKYAWNTIRNNPDIIFLIITKRISRVCECLPEDWGEGYNNVVLCSTCENQRRADERLSEFIKIPCKHRWVTCSPLLEPINLTKYLATGLIECVEATGERTCRFDARKTKFDWVKSISDQCKSFNVRFNMLYLGHNFEMPDGTTEQDWSGWYRSEKAEKLNLTSYNTITFNLNSLSITY